MKIRELLRGYAKVCRFEYLPAELPGIFVPILLGYKYTENLNILFVLEGFVTFALLYFSGFMINAISDYHVDKLYKSFVSEGVDILGVSKIKKLLITHLVLAILLSAHMSVAKKNLIFLILCLLGIFFGIGYSLEPFSFKVRGILHPIALMTSAFLFPALFLYFSVADVLPINILLIFVGFTLLHYGLALTNQSADLLEDKSCGLRTPAVRWGLSNTLALSLILMFIGLGLIVTGAFQEASKYETYTIAGYVISKHVLYVFVFLSLTLYSVPFYGTTRLYLASKEKSSLKEKIQRIKKILKYPKWQASGVWSIFVLCVLLVIVSPYVIPKQLANYKISASEEVRPDYFHKSAYVQVRVNNSGSEPLEPFVIKIAVKVITNGKESYYVVRYNTVTINVSETWILHEIVPLGIGDNTIWVYVYTDFDSDMDYTLEYAYAEKITIQRRF